MKLVSSEFIGAILDTIREHFAPAEEATSVRVAISGAAQWANGTLPPDRAPEPEPELQPNYPPPPPPPPLGAPGIEQSVVTGALPPPPPPPPQPRSEATTAVPALRGPDTAIDQARARLRKTAGPPPRPIVALVDHATETLAPRVPYMAAFSEARAAGFSGAVSHTNGTEPTGACSSASVKVLVLQKCTVDANELDATLADAQQTDKSGRPVDIVVLPEGALHEAGEPTRAGNATLRELSAVVAKHRCWAVLGTMIEIVKAGRGAVGTIGRAETEDKFYATAVVVGPDGEVAHTYRKRAIPSDDGTMSMGTSVGVFETEFGKVGILICYDSEDDTIVQELLDEDPVLIINPIHISAGRTGGAGGVTDQTLAKWRTACDHMSRRMDYLVATSKSCCGWIRADQPYPVGLGSSMAIGRFETQFVPVMTDAIWPLQISLDPRRTLLAPPPRRSRTDKWDNCGTRYHRRSIALPAKANGVAPVSCMFVEACGAKDTGPAGHMGKLNVTYSDGSQDLLAISQLRVEQVDAAAPTDTDETSLLSGAERDAREHLQQLLQEGLTASHSPGSDFAAPVRLEPPAAAEDQARQGFYLHSSPVSSGLLNLCRWERDGAGQLQADPHHSFEAGPLGASAVAYDWRRGRLAMISANPLRTLIRDRACVMEQQQRQETATSSAAMPKRPVASLGIARHRFVASILTISQHRHPVSLSELLA